MCLSGPTDDAAVGGGRVQRNKSRGGREGTWRGRSRSLCACVRARSFLVSRSVLVCGWVGGWVGLWLAGTGAHRVNGGVCGVTRDCFLDTRHLCHHGPRIGIYFSAGGFNASDV